MSKPEIRHLPAQGFQVMPWKNGGGQTTEIWVDPEGASLQSESPFQWRISRALVGGSGPFSTFDGYDRVLIQLSGGEMKLSHKGEVPRRLTPLVPYSFKGEWATSSIQDGPTEDFNVMVLRNAQRAVVEVVDLAVGERPVPLRLGDQTLVYWFRGEGEAEAKSQGQRFQVQCGDGLLVTGSPTVQWRATTPSTLIVASIFKLVYMPAPGRNH